VGSLWVVTPFQRQHVVVSGDNDGLPPALDHVFMSNHQVADFDAVPILRQALGWCTRCRSCRWGVSRSSRAGLLRRFGCQFQFRIQVAPDRWDKTGAIGMNATDRQFFGKLDLARSHWPEQLQLH
jgi:hypothetical protein